jgi:uncharacterized membrane protein HdeD (DUF308 family)
MLDILARGWWVFAVRGIAAIAFGILAVLWPAPTIVAFVLLFAVYAIVDGGSMLVSLVRGDSAARRNAWSVAIIGILGVIAGVVAFVLPGPTAIALTYVVGAWAIAAGVFQIVAAIRLRQQIEGELWLAIGGILTLVFGLYLVLFPGSGIISLVLLVAAWAIAFGVFSLILAFRLRGIRSATA